MLGNRERFNFSIEVDEVVNHLEEVLAETTTIQPTLSNNSNNLNSF